MKTKSTTTDKELNAFLEERQQIAWVLQNDLNQILASVLLCIQFTGKETPLNENKLFSQAESNLKIAIGKVSTLHYSLSKELI
jgi:hypothetical protein